MAEPPQGLLDLIKEHAWRKHAKVLLCAQDVCDALMADSAPAPKRMPWEIDVGTLLGINVIANPDAAPGTWRLVRHDHCRVEGRSVHHDECTVLGEHPAAGRPRD